MAGKIFERGRFWARLKQIAFQTRWQRIGTARALAIRTSSCLDNEQVTAAAAATREAIKLLRRQSKGRQVGQDDFERCRPLSMALSPGIILTTNSTHSVSRVVLRDGRRNHFTFHLITSVVRLDNHSLLFLTIAPNLLALRYDWSIRVVFL